MTDKKNQHYVPKFYLRKFSYQGNEKQIGLFNVRKSFFYATAPLKNQGSKDFFYGVDGIIEDGLSVIEGTLAESLRNAISNRRVPDKLSKEHANLLMFIGLTHLRNPVIIQNLKDLVKSAQARAQELDPDFDPTEFFPDIDHEKVVKVALSQVREVIPIMADLDFKLLINRTKTPFITSDFPVIKYNQFLENRKWSHGKTGYGNTGLQIIIPLNDELAILFYDGLIYNVGSKKKDYLGIIKEKDVDQLNTLQLLNYLETVYFNEKMTEKEIRKLAEASAKFTQPNEVYSKLHFLINHGAVTRHPKENLIVSGSTELEMNLKVGGISFTNAAKAWKLSSASAQLRPIPMALMAGKNHKGGKQ